MTTVKCSILAKLEAVYIMTLHTTSLLFILASLDDRSHRNAGAKLCAQLSLSVHVYSPHMAQSVCACLQAAHHH